MPDNPVNALLHPDVNQQGAVRALLLQIKYLPLCLAMGTCPDEPRSFFMQQYR